MIRIVRSRTLSGLRAEAAGRDEALAMASAARAEAAGVTAIKQALNLMPGLPGRDDCEVRDLMEVIAGLPRENVDEIVRDLLRAALGYQRTCSTGYLTCLAEDAVVTIGLRRDPGLDRALRGAPREPAGLGGSVDVEEMLANAWKS